MLLSSDSDSEPAWLKGNSSGNTSCILEAGNGSGGFAAATRFAGGGRTSPPLSSVSSADSQLAETKPKFGRRAVQ
jgi:hypothetical protein